ncbi:MAG: hypothetical protein KGM91_21545 [Burkholderiales bacterium]|nr:hypothetical protein [Burkholderiales bacterium]
MTLTRLGRLAAYIVSFALARGALFAAPLLLANLLTSADYGLLETAQAAASLLANVAVFGTASVVPLVLLGHTRATTMAGIVAHHLALVGACAATGIAAVLAGAAHSWGLAALFCAVTVMQSLGSTHLKTEGRSEASVLLDAGHFGLMALAAGLAHFAGASRAMPWVVAAALVYVTLLGTAYLRLLTRLPRSSLGQWRAAIGLGLPLMLGGVVTLLATTSGRLGMGLLAGPLVAADYAVLSRAAALPIVAHQLILVARFRNLFTLPAQQVERAAATIVALVAASAFGFWLLAPWIGRLFGSAFVHAWTVHPLPGAWIAAQAILWSAIALNDLMILRHQVMHRILPVSVGFLTLALGVGWLIMRRVGPTLEHFVFAHGVLMLLFYGAQSAAMAAAGIRRGRVWITAASAYLAMVTLATALA